MELLKLLQNRSQDRRKCNEHEQVGITTREKMRKNAAKNQQIETTHYINGGLDRDKAILESWNNRVGGGTIIKGRDGRWWLKNKFGVFRSDGSGFARDAYGKTGAYTKNLLDENGSFIDKKNIETFLADKKTKVDEPTGTTKTTGTTKAPETHTATYNPLTGASGAYAVKGWTTNAWGGGKKGVLDASMAQKLGLKEGATAEDAQNFLISKGYGITPDNYWGKQSQAAYDDYINRGNVKATAAETPQLDNQDERHNYSTYNPQTKQYSYDTSFEITPQQLKEAGVTNFRGYQNFMGNADNANNQYKNVYNFFNRVKEQNQSVNFGDENSFNNFFGTSNHFGRKDRNRIIQAGARSQYNYDKVSPQGTPIISRSDYGKQYDALYDKLSADDRTAGNISWVNSGNNRIPVYQDSEGSYYKVGDDGNLTRTGTYTMGSDGKYSVSFKHGGSLNKFQQGGSINMDEQQLQQAFLQYLAQQTGAKSQQELEQVIQQMGENGLKQAYAQFMQAMQQQQVQAAKFGAKLNYIKQLNGQCPQGMEMHYYKEGGRLCKKCMQAKQNGRELETPSNPIDAFKCGRKIKKNQQDEKLHQIKSKAPYSKVTKHQKGGSFEQAFNNAYGKQRYFTWNGKVYAAYKGKKENDKAFQGAVDNLEEQANALKDYNRGSHLGWTPGTNEHANFRHNESGTMEGILPEVTVTGKRISPKQKANNQRKQYFDQWTAYVKKWHPNMLGKFKNTMESMGYNYNQNTGTYDKNGKPVYRLNNGQLQTQNIYTGNWNDINNSDALPGMPANGLSVRLQK